MTWVTMLLMLPLAELLVWLECPKGMSFVQYLGIEGVPSGIYGPRSRRVVPDPDGDAATVDYTVAYESPDNPKVRNPGDSMAVASF